MLPWVRPLLSASGALALSAAGLAAGASRAADLACDADTVVRTIRQGESAPPWALRCTNLSSGPLDYGLSESADWLAIEPDGALGLPPGASADHVLAFAASGLAPGLYTATLALPGGAPPIEVQLVVAAPSLPPPIVLQPGSQPPEVATDPGLAARHPAFDQAPLVGLASSVTGLAACRSCHAGPEAEPIFDAWSGSMMAHASRDPLLWAALAVAEQAVAGIGDTCVRCHVPAAWVAGRSVPSSGAAILDADADGVTCMLCHRLAEPGGAEPAARGEQSPPFVAASPEDGSAWLGNAMFSLFQDAATPDAISRLGPYAVDTLPFHDSRPSAFQRSGALCGTCHDVSNPVVGDLAPGHGALRGAEPADGWSGDPYGEVSSKAAFRLPPHAYGVEQRTYSEWLAGGLAATRVADFATLPDELRTPGGAVAQAHAAALQAGQGGDHADGTPRTFTCQSCHMPPTVEPGCRYASPRSDLARHDFMGGNHFAPDAIRYLADPARYTGDPERGSQSRLRVGGALDDLQWQALAETPTRAHEALRSAVALRLLGPADALANTVRVTNLTGHKLPSGYPDGRRMWLRMRWRDANGALVREDGAYGERIVEDLDGDQQPDVVRTLLDPEATVYEVHAGISREWARCLVAPAGARCSESEPRLRGLGLEPTHPVVFPEDAAPLTLADVANGAPGSVVESFQLALNDRIVSDSRIPPWRMAHRAARERNALPVPPERYLDELPLPGADAFHRHYDDVPLEPPPGAVRGELALLYQTTSWEYVRFLWKAGAGASDPFLAGAGEDLLEAWRATGMAEPVVMAQLVVPEPGASSAAASAFAALAVLLRRAALGGTASTAGSAAGERSAQGL